MTMDTVRDLVRATRLGGLVMCLVLSSANAGVLVSGGGGIPAFTGTQLFDNSAATFTVSANVDYAVFAPGAFGVAFPGEDTSGGAHYVYAYQIFNLDTDVLRLTVGLDGDESLGSIGFISDGLVNPSDSLYVGAGPTSAAWDFDPATLTNGLSSAILFFTSPGAPEMDSAVVEAEFVDSHDLPSPLPEPATLSLVALGTGIVFFGRRRRS
jgi:hypothetical protein